MATPRSFIQALENGYKFKRVYDAGSINSKVRIDVEPRSYRPGMKSILGFWLTRKYVQRNYPQFNI